MKASFGLRRPHIIINFDSLTIKKMNKFKIVPLSKSFAEKIRLTMRDDFGHQVTEQIATGAGPCRVSMKPISVESGVLSSWLALATKSARICSVRFIAVRSVSVTSTA